MAVQSLSFKVVQHVVVGIRERLEDTSTPKYFD